jgi:hypothetical protein
MDAVFQIAGGPGLYGERLTVALGFVTLISAIATFATCRSCLSFLGRLGLKNLADSPWYRPFYKYHGYFWWVFVMGLVLHLLTALMHTAIPTSGDPDALSHLIILSLGLASLVLAIGVLASCRSLLGLLNLFREKSLLGENKYLSFYRFHSYYWLLLILLIAAHFTSSYIHIGIWPR